MKKLIMNMKWAVLIMIMLPFLGLAFFLKMIGFFKAPETEILINNPDSKKYGSFINHE